MALIVIVILASFEVDIVGSGDCIVFVLWLAVTEPHCRGLYRRAPCSYITPYVQLILVIYRYITLLTPLTLIIDRATFCRLFKYIYFVATASTP